MKHHKRNNNYILTSIKLPVADEMALDNGEALKVDWITHLVRKGEMMNKYQQSFERLERYFQGRLERGNNKYPFTRHDLLLIEKAIYERSHLIKALKDINEILERLTLEQKKPLGATVYSIQAIIIETLERGNDDAE